MPSREELIKMAGEIVSPTHRIRIMDLEEGRFYCANDIASACGIKAPWKWIDRNFDTKNEESFRRLEYPIKTTQGIRRYHRIFVNEKTGRDIMGLTACSDEVRSWMESEVFVVQIDEKAKEQKTSSEDKAPSALEKEALSQRIDRILFDLLDLKRNISSLYL